VPKGNQEMVAAAFRTIFAQATSEEMSNHRDHVGTTFSAPFEQAARLMDGAKDEVHASSAFPARSGVSCGARTPWNG